MLSQFRSQFRIYVSPSGGSGRLYSSRASSFPPYIMSASFLSMGSVMLKYRNSRSIASSQSSHAFPLSHGSSRTTNGCDRKFLVSVVTRIASIGFSAISKLAGDLFEVLAGLSLCFIYHVAFDDVAFRGRFSSTNSLKVRQ